MKIVDLDYPNGLYRSRSLDSLHLFGTANQANPGYASNSYGRPLTPPGRSTDDLPSTAIPTLSPYSIPSTFTIPAAYSQPNYAQPVFAQPLYKQPTGYIASPLDLPSMPIGIGQPVPLFPDIPMPPPGFEDGRQPMFQGARQRAVPRPIPHQLLTPPMPLLNLPIPLQGPTAKLPTLGLGQPSAFAPYGKLFTRESKKLHKQNTQLVITLLVLGFLLAVGAGGITYIMLKGGPAILIPMKETTRLQFGITRLDLLYEDELANPLSYLFAAKQKVFSDMISQQYLKGIFVVEKSHVNKFESASDGSLTAEMELTVLNLEPYDSDGTFNQVAITIGAKADADPSTNPIVSSSIIQLKAQSTDELTNNAQ